MAACNALGATRRYEEPVLSTILKVVGADVVSIGRFEAAEGDETVVEEDARERRYRKLVIRNARLVGAILIGWPELSESVAHAVKSGAAPDASWAPTYALGSSARESLSRERLGISPG